jgi:hypothetical protein
MARGVSGRIVIEINPELKQQLYSALAVKNQSLKDWFVEAANSYLNGQKDPDRPKVKRAKIALDKTP